QRVVKVLGGEAGVTATAHLVLATQPPAQPPIGVPINRVVRLADRTQTIIIGPAAQHPVQSFHHLFGIEQARSAVRLLVDLPDQAFDALLRWPSTQIGPTRTMRVTTPKRISQKVKAFSWYTTKVSLLIVHRQPQPLHDLPHFLQRQVGLTSAANHQIIGI